MKRLFEFLTIFSLIISTSLFASPPEVFKLLKLEAGRLEVQKDNSESCSDGPFKIAGSAGEEVLMVGPEITFPLTKSVEDSEGCKEETTPKISEGSVTVLTRIHSCPEKLKKLESNVEETLTAKDKVLTYTRKSGKEQIECVFLWSKNP